MIRRALKRIRREWYDRSILFKGLVVVAVPVVPLLVLHVLYFAAQTRVASAEEELSRTLAAARASQELLIPLLNVEAGVRGYALTGEEVYLDVADLYREILPQRMDRLHHALTKVEGGPQAIPVVEGHVQEKLDALDRLQAASDAVLASPFPGETISPALLRDGAAAMDGLEEALEPFRTRPDALLSEREELALDPGGLPARIVAVAGGMGILGGIAAAVLFSTGVANRLERLARNTRRLSRGEELLPALACNDEIGRLARGLEEARELLEERSRALQESEARLERAIRGSRDGLWDWDLETDQVYYSPRWKEILGYGEDELPHTYETFSKRIHPEDLPRVEQAIEDHLAGRTPELDLELRMRHRDGDWRWIASRGKCARDDEGQAVRMAGFHSDITVRRQREEELGEARRAAESATQAKSAFLASMSHELRTPLNAVIGFSELLEDGTAGELNPKQAGYVDNVLSSARHLLNLINDILDLSKVEAGKMKLEVAEVEPGPLLRNSLTIVKGLAHKNEVSLELELDEPLPTVRIDEARVKQMVYNLLSNAVKFTAEGGRVTLAAEASNGELRIHVRDTGVGIDPGDLDRIFGEFEQVDTSYGRNQQGTGLGLPLTRQLAELHGGAVSAESEPGKGSVFTLHLPLAGPEAESLPTEDAQAARGEPKTAAGEATLGAATVLVVEDDPSFRKLLRTYLTEEGYRVLEAEDGDRALELALQERPDAITLDVVLPRRDGWQVLKELKAHPETREIPVFTVTVTEDRELGLTLGAAGFFTKPVDRTALIEAVSALVPRDRESLRILAVDDDEDARILIQETLEELGHEVEVASGGRDGIEIARRERPDLIVLDLMMPEVTGFDVAASLRNDPDTARIPILVWTAKDLTPEDRSRLNSRVQAVQVKGAKEDLLEALSRVLAGART